MHKNHPTRHLQIEPLEPRTLLTAAPGQLDTTFANAGKLIIASTGADYFYISRAALGPTGKEVVVGTRQSASSGVTIAARLNTDGTLDTTFGHNGTIELGTDISSGLNDYSMTVQNDGKILIAGVPSGQSDDPYLPDVMVLRLTVDGSRDISFGNAGVTIIPAFYEATNSDLARIVVRHDGKIMLSSGNGTEGSGSGPFSFARLTPNGLLDSTYRNGGAFHSSLRVGGLGNVYSAQLQADGSILIAGDKYGPRIAIERYTPDGFFDLTFGKNGRILSALSDDIYLNPAASVSPSGDIILSTWTDKGTADKDTALLTLARFHPNGTLDTTFGVAGLAKISVDYLYLNSRNDLAPTPRFQGGNILAAESTALGTTIVRLTSNGILDTSFGTAGLAKIETGTGRGGGDADPLDLAPDGKIYFSQANNSIQQPRATANGQLDSTYGATPIELTGQDADTLGAAAVLPDGRFVLLGLSVPGEPPTGPDAFIRRYMADGQPDTSLAVDGAYSTAQDFFFNQPAQLLTDSLGRVVLANWFASSDAGPGLPGVFRFIETGTPDTSFVNGYRHSLGNFTSAGLALEPNGAIVTLSNERGNGSAYPGKDNLAILSPNGRTLHARMFSAPGADNAAITSTPDNKIILAGPFANTSNQLQLQRYTQDLKLDPTFGTNGIVTPAVPANFFLKTIATQPDGKILLAGRSGHKILLLRFNPNGTPDQSFGHSGQITTAPIGNESNIPILRNLIIQPTGQIILGGYTNSAPNSDSDLLLIRYTPTGHPDPTFGTNGIIKSDLDGHDVLSSIALTPDNKLLAFATTTYLGNGITTPNDSDIVVTRYTL